MKKKIEVLYYPLLVLGVLLMLAVSCKKNSDITPNNQSNITTTDTISGTWIGGTQTPSNTGYPTFTNNIVITHLSGDNYTCSGFYGNYTVSMIRHYNVDQGHITMSWDHVTNVSVGGNLYIVNYGLFYEPNNKLYLFFDMAHDGIHIACQYSGEGYHK